MREPRLKVILGLSGYKCKFFALIPPLSSIKIPGFKDDKFSISVSLGIKLSSITMSAPDSMAISASAIDLHSTSILVVKDARDFVARTADFTSPL